MFTDSCCLFPMFIQSFVRVFVVTDVVFPVVVTCDITTLDFFRWDPFCSNRDQQRSYLFKCLGMQIS